MLNKSLGRYFDGRNLWIKVALSLHLILQKVSNYRGLAAGTYVTLTIFGYRGQAAVIRGCKVIRRCNGIRRCKSQDRLLT